MLGRHPPWGQCGVPAGEERALWVACALHPMLDQTLFTPGWKPSAFSPRLGPLLATETISALFCVQWEPYCLSPSIPRGLLLLLKWGPFPPSVGQNVPREGDPHLGLTRWPQVGGGARTGGLDASWGNSGSPERRPHVNERSLLLFSQLLFSEQKLEGEQNLTCHPMEPGD